MHRPLAWYNRVGTSVSLKQRPPIFTKTTTLSMATGSCRIETAGDHCKQSIVFFPVYVWMEVEAEGAGTFC